MTAGRPRLGRIERSVLEELEEHQRWLTGHEIAASWCGRREMTISELARVHPGLRESILRALRSLKRKGLVASQESYPGRLWALAERAAKDARNQRANDRRHRQQERESEQRFRAFMDGLQAETLARADDADRIIARLAKVLGHLRNTNDHELLAAARMAEELRAGTGLEWADLLSPLKLRRHLQEQPKARPNAGQGVTSP